MIKRFVLEIDSKTRRRICQFLMLIINCFFLASLSLAVAQETPAIQEKSLNDQNPDVAQQRQIAIVKAVKRVESSVVRLEAFSSDSKSPSVGSGFVIEDGGYIVTSSFFVRSTGAKLFVKDQANAIPVSIVGTDYSRNLTYLRMKGSSTFSVPKLVQRKIRVGETVIAIGRTLSPESVNVSVGIISAKNRILGKAIQTDAKVSPTNYGGPLVDLNGDVVGALVALSPDSSDLDAGAQWYDSGIGFAIPINDVRNSLALVKELAGKKIDSSETADLFAGKLGVRFSAKNIYSDALLITSVLPRSPASVAGVRSGAIVTMVNNKPVSRLAQFQSEVGRMYSGETVTLHLLQDEKTRIVNCSLVSSISPFRFAYLGILPDSNYTGGGLKVLLVDKSSLADQFLIGGDVILSLNGMVVDSPLSVEQFFAQVESGESVSVTFQRDGVQQTTTIPLGELSKPISDDTFGEFDRSKANGSLVQKDIRVPGLSNRCVALVPNGPILLKKKTANPKGTIANLKPRQKQRLLVWLPESNDIDFGKVREKWQAVLKRQNTTLLVPLPGNLNGWTDDEREFVWKATREFVRQHPQIVDRMVFCGGRKAADVCLKLAMERRESTIGIILSDPDFSREMALPFSDPQNRFLVKCLLSGERRISGDALKRAFEKNCIPVDVSPVEDSIEFSMSDIKSIETWLMLLNRL